MPDRARIRIRHSLGNPKGLRWSRASGWAWHCPICDTGGRASWWSNRGRGSSRTRPFQRVIAAVDRHLQARHRDAHYAYVLRKGAAA